MPCRWIDSSQRLLVVAQSFRHARYLVETKLPQIAKFLGIDLVLPQKRDWVHVERAEQLYGYDRYKVLVDEDTLRYGHRDVFEIMSMLHTRIPTDKYNEWVLVL